jgi:hypothetical protein
MSEREAIMDLIRNEYDPCPDFDGAAYPALASEWDDGAGRIADAILADETVRLKSVLSAKWQPIETAPRDGSHFWAYQKRHEYSMFECWWAENHEGGFWMDYIDSEPEPTHYAPLPEPPEAT